PQPVQFALLLAAAILGGAAITLVTQAFRVGTASTVAPFDYSGLLWSALIGWIFWGEIPSSMAATGLFITLLAGLYLGWQHSLRGRAAAARRV
ncbi:MAG: hypothetical protein L0H37_08930, partial [Nitrosospira sp.]|nr:hypothetical protein [Nitrosospira sp.]